MSETKKREPVAETSGDVLAIQKEQLRSIYPGAFVEGQLDFERLKAVLGGGAEAGPNRFSFTWAGKNDALSLLQTPSRGTLMPFPEESVDFDQTKNAFVEGENLEVLKLLLKPYFGRVKVIYIDPPYNKLKDYVYPDNYSDPLRNYLIQTKQADDDGNFLTNKVDRSGRLHSGWLSMIYPRLFIARQLLEELGAIFVSIDDDEVHHLRLVMNEVFGEENFVGTLVWQRSKKGDAKLVSVTHEYVLVYARDKEAVIKAGKWRKKKPGVDEVLSHYESLVQQLHGEHAAISEAMKNWYNGLPQADPKRAHQHYRWSDARGLYFDDNFAGPDDGRKSRPRYDIIHPTTGKPCKKPSTGWRWDEETTLEALAENPPRVHFGADETTIPKRKSYLKEIDSEPFSSVFYRDGRGATRELEQLIGSGLMDFPKSVEVLKELIDLVADEDSIIMDFFAGSCPTAQAVFELNRERRSHRSFIVVQLPEPTGHDRFSTIAEIGKARIRKVIERLKARPQQEFDLEDNATPEDLGFKVFKLSEPNIQPWNPEVDRDPDHYQQKLLKFNDPLVAGWRPENVLWEVALREGFGLNTRFSSRELSNGAKLYEVTDPDKDPPQRFLVCLDDTVDAELIKELAKIFPLAPDLLFICRDAALDDTAAANLALQCRLKTI